MTEKPRKRSGAISQDQVKRVENLSKDDLKAVQALTDAINEHDGNKKEYARNQTPKQKQEKDKGITYY